MSIDFDAEFSSESDLEKFIDTVLNEVTNDENGISVIVHERAEQIRAAHKALEMIAHGDNVCVTYDMNSPYTSMGAVSVVGKDIIITNPKLFSALIKIASNFEIYQKTDGTVQMDFTFHNLTRKARKRK